MTKKPMMEEALSQVKVQKFKKGDRVPLMGHDYDGCYETTADQPGYVLFHRGRLCVVTEKMLAEATPVGTCVHAPIVVSEPEAEVEPETSHRVRKAPLRVYQCRCPDKCYDSWSFDRWLLEMDEEECGIRSPNGVYKLVGKDKRPLDWPDSWVWGRCMDCNSPIALREKS